MKAPLGVTYLIAHLKPWKLVGATTDPDEATQLADFLRASVIVVPVIYSAEKGLIWDDLNTSIGGDTDTATHVESVVESPAETDDPPY